MIVRWLKRIGIGIAIVIGGLTITAILLLFSTGTIVFAAMPDRSLPAVARISCDQARMFAGRFGNASEDEIREEMKRQRVSEFDMIAIMDRCNIKPGPRR